MYYTKREKPELNPQNNPSAMALLREATWAFKKGVEFKDPAKRGMSFF